MAQFSSDCTMTDNGHINIALELSFECILLTIPCGFEPFLILPFCF